MGNYLSETSKYANIEMTIVAKMKLIYHNHKYGVNNHVYFLSPDQMGRQMDNMNRKCIFGNDLLQGTQSRFGFSAAVGFFEHN